MTTATEPASRPTLHPVVRKVRAGYPLFWLVAPDPFAADEAIVRSLRADDRTKGHRLARWRLAEGLSYVEDGGDVGGEAGVQYGSPDPEAADVVGFLTAVRDAAEPTVYWAHDLHLAFGLQLNDVALSLLKRAVPALRKSGSTLVLVGAQASTIPEVRALGPVVDLPLPTRGELRAAVAEFVVENSVAWPGGGAEAVLYAEIADQLRGLTLAQAVDALAEALLLDGCLSGATIGRLKASEIAKGGVLELHAEPPGGLDTIGGLDVLKKWVLERRDAFSDEAREFGLPGPKGVLLTGAPGCGKSAAARATATALGVPLLRLDMGRVMAGVVGASEHNMREAIRVAEAVAPCVLFVDEVEKGLVGAMSGLDSGAGAKVLGTLLTWLAEKESPVLVLATSNDVSKLPPELLRKGRFDELFFVDLPNEADRAAILQIHVTKRGRSSVRADRAFASASDGYSGAEIEAAVVSALFRCFAEGRRDLTIGDVCEALSASPALSVTMKPQVAALRDWACGRAVLASTREEQTKAVERAAARRVR